MLGWCFLAVTALSCVGLGFALYRSEQHHDWFIAGPLLAFELVYAKVGLDCSGARGALYFGGMAAILAGAPTLAAAAVVAAKNPRAAGLAIAVVAGEWTVMAAIAGAWATAVPGLALAIGGPLALVKLHENEERVDLWIESHTGAITLALAGVIVAMPAYMTWGMMQLWAPPAELVAWTEVLYPDTFTLTVATLSPLGVVWAVVKDLPNPGVALGTATAFVVPLALSWSLPALLTAPAAAVALVIVALWALVGLCGVLLPAAFARRSGTTATSSSRGS